MELLQRQIGAFTNGHPYAVIKNGHPKEGKVEWVVAKVRRRPDPDRWGLMAGDCIHALRSRLDHIAWELAGSDPGDKTTMFPLFDDRDRFAGKGLWRIEKLPKRAQTLIKCVQPYRRPDPSLDFLSILTALDNLDKHRTIPLVVAVLEKSTLDADRLRATEPAPVGPEGTGQHQWTVRREPIQGVGDVLATLTIDPPDPHMHVKSEFVVGVVFSEELPAIGREQVLRLLDNLVGRVRTVVGLFDRRFEEQAGTLQGAHELPPWKG